MKKEIIDGFRFYIATKLVVWTMKILPDGNAKKEFCIFAVLWMKKMIVEEWREISGND